MSDFLLLIRSLSSLTPLPPRRVGPWCEELCAGGGMIKGRAATGKGQCLKTSLDKAFGLFLCPSDECYPQRIFPAGSPLATALLGARSRASIGFCHAFRCAAATVLQAAREVVFLTGVAFKHHLETRVSDHCGDVSLYVFRQDFDSG